MDFNKFLEMKPMKYTGGASAKSHVERFLSNPNSFAGWYYTTKVDGEWCRIVHDMDGNVTVQGRGISTVTKKHKDNTELVPHIVDEVKAFIPKGTVLIGELSFEQHLNHVQTDVGSILRCKAPKALQRQDGKPLHFFVFDVLAFNGESYLDKPYKERTSIYGFSGQKYIHIIQRMPVGPSAVEFLDEVLNSGGEGIMIMNGEGKYLPGSRSVNVSLKIKKELGEITAKVVSTIDPKVSYEGKEADTWEYKDENGNLVTKYHALGWKAGVVFDYKGNNVRVTSGISDEDAKWLASDDAQEMIERGELYADIAAMSEFVTDGKPSLRHPVILKLRTDL